MTDQVSTITSQLLAELYRHLHVHSIVTSPYHPQTDDLVEHFNQTLKAMLSRFADSNGKIIPCILFAYRELLQTTTGCLLFELLFGWDIRGPLDILMEQWEPEKSDENVVSLYRRSCQRWHYVVQKIKKARESKKIVR